MLSVGCSGKECVCVCVEEGVCGERPDLWKKKRVATF